MKSFKSVIGLAIILCSCNSVEESQERRIDPVLNKIFTQEHANYESNAMVREQALEQLLIALDSLVELNYLSDIPLRALRVSEYAENEDQALVQFSTSLAKKDKSLLSNKLEFDLIAFMPKAVAATIQEGEVYQVKAHNFKALNEKETYQLVNQTYFSPEPAITPVVVGSNDYEIQIGVFRAEVDSVSPYTLY